jgi:hypothetical protein
MGLGLYSYDESVGIFCLSSPIELSYTVMQLDGTVDTRARNPGVFGFILDQQTNGWIVCSGAGFSDLSTWDVENGVMGPAPFYSGAPASTLGIQVRCADRFLAFDFSVLSGGMLRVLTSSFGDPATYTAEATVPISSTYGGGFPVSVSRLGGSMLALCAQNGAVFHYDTATKAFLNYKAFLPPNIAAWYSPSLGVYVVLTGTALVPTVSIYADVPQPYALSNPVPASALTVGRVTSVSVTLTGQQGEPCPDELIEWTLVSGDGSLDSIQSTTDTNGTAAVNYVAPLSLGTNPTIAADVVF